MLLPTHSPTGRTVEAYRMTEREECPPKHGRQDETYVRRIRRQLWKKSSPRTTEFWHDYKCFQSRTVVTRRIRDGGGFDNLNPLTHHDPQMWQNVSVQQHISTRMALSHLSEGCILLRSAAYTPLCQQSTHPRNMGREG